MKKTIAIVCGGKSGEHEVSLRSAFYVYNNINIKKYCVVIIAIDKKGRRNLLMEEKLNVQY